jgi:hypothetical protein
MRHPEGGLPTEGSSFHLAFASCREGATGQILQSLGLLQNDIKLINSIREDSSDSWLKKEQMVSDYKRTEALDICPRPLF